MKSLFILILLVSFFACEQETNKRHVEVLKTNWKFTRDSIENGEKFNIDESNWQDVSVPHDWAIYGPFDSLNDAQSKRVIADLEKKARVRLGRTAGLPHIGIGWYRKKFNVDRDIEKVFVEFDGAMSHAQVFLNEKFVGAWPYGYSSFTFEITDFVKPGENLLAVRLENKEQSSRWYPGAGIYRNVRLVSTGTNHVQHWGTYITTPVVSSESAEVKVETKLILTDKAELLTEIYTANGKLIAEKKEKGIDKGNQKVMQFFHILEPDIWSIESPEIYTVKSKVIVANKIVDSYESTFGIRSFKFTPDDGFHLNGKRVQINGVCMHHDLGPLGAAVNNSALYRQLQKLKEMGCNAIRTAHNPPTPELLAMCDTMGFIVMDEAFDEWKNGKNRNGYKHHFDEWAERDLVSMIHRDRNHPSVFMWSVGNEILEQFTDEGWEPAKYLVEIVRREDPTRPSTIGMNREAPALNNFAAQFDLKGWNYHTHLHPWLKEQHPNWCFIASESEATASSRGYFDLNVIPRKHYERDNLQCSDYALDFCRWSNTPDVGFAMLDDNPHVAGEFVWTGFDYLGEPTPYNIQWPTKNSYFGILDLCGFPKSMYYLYKSRWSNEDVLHVLPHWNWDEDTDNVPIHVFTSFNSAELFVNGRSYGKRFKSKDEVYSRYRLVWDSVAYEPGEVKVVAFDENQKSAMEEVIRTAGNPVGLKLNVGNKVIKADGESLAFIEIDVIDENGNFCPTAHNKLTFNVSGDGVFVAAANGNSTDITQFQSLSRNCFYGKCLAIVQSTSKAGVIDLTVSSPELKSSTVSIETRKE